MRWFRFLLVGLLSFAAHLMVAPASAEIPGGVLAARWAEYSSPHITIISDLQPEDAIALSLHLGRLGEVLERVEPALQAHPPQPIVVYAFRDASMFRYYDMSRNKANIGIFVPTHDRNRIAFVSREASKDRFGIPYGTIIQSYLHDNLPGPPKWLAYGLAGYYESFRAGVATAEIGELPIGVVAWLRAQKLLSIEELVTTSQATTPDREGERRQLFQTQSRAFVHYLRHGGEQNADRLGQFTAGLRDGKKPLAAFLEAFPSERWEAMGRDFERYLARGEFDVHHYSFTGKFDPVDVHQKPLGRAEMLYELGELAAAQEGGESTAADHFEAALRVDPSHAGAIAQLGFLADSRGDSTRAESLYVRAMTLAGSEAAPFAIAGQGALQRALRAAFPDDGDGSTASSTPAALLEARKRFSRCLEIDPANTQALTGFGTSYLFDPDPPPAAILALEKVARTLPGRTDVILVLLQLRVSAGQSAEATRMFRDRLEAGLGPEEARAARAAILSSELDRADRLSRQGRKAEADSLLEQLAAGASSDSVRQEAIRRLQEGRSMRQDSTAWDLLLRAKQAEDQGQFEKAKTLFEMARDGAIDPELRETAARSVARIQPAIDIDQAWMLIRQRKWREARALAQSVLKDPGLELSEATGARNVLRRVDAGIAFDDALMLIRNGKLKEARVQFERALGLATDPDLKKYIQTRIQQIDAAITGTKK